MSRLKMVMAWLPFAMFIGLLAFAVANGDWIFILVVIVLIAFSGPLPPPLRCRVDTEPPEANTIVRCRRHRWHRGMHKGRWTRYVSWLGPR